MGAAAPAKPAAPPSGAYLTDGERLYRVVDAARDMVALENCQAPGENPMWFPVRKVVDRGWRRVRPA